MNQFLKTWAAGIAVALTFTACDSKPAASTTAKPEGEKKAAETKPAAGGGAQLTISCGSVGEDAELCKMLVDEWTAKTGNKVNMFSTPKESTDNLALMRQQFAAGSSDFDVLTVDVVWPAMIKDHLLDLTAAAGANAKEHFPHIIANNTVDGKLVAMPWFTDAGLLYYRKDLLEKYKLQPPATWEDLATTAKKIQDGERAAGNKDMQGYVFQAKAYEGLTCNAIEWVASYNGGGIVEKDGKVSINNPNAAKALDTAATWIKTISPEGVLNYGEEEVRGVFQKGNSVYMRNWPYAWKLVNGADSPIKDKVGVTPMPKGGADGKATAALGGWQLGVSKYSKHPQEAIDLVMYMTSKEAQKRLAIKGAKNPTYPELYKDGEILKANPFFSDLINIFNASVARPSTVTGQKYNDVSTAVWNATNSVLSGKIKGKEAVLKMEEDINRISRGKW